MQGAAPAALLGAGAAQGTTPALATTACVDECVQWGDVCWIPCGDARGAPLLVLWSRQVSPVTALTVELETHGS